MLQAFFGMDSQLSFWSCNWCSITVDLDQGGVTHRKSQTEFVNKSSQAPYPISSDILFHLFNLEAV